MRYAGGAFFWGLPAGGGGISSRWIFPSGDVNLSETVLLLVVGRADPGAEKS